MSRQGDDMCLIIYQLTGPSLITSDKPSFQTWETKTITALRLQSEHIVERIKVIAMTWSQWVTHLAIKTAWVKLKITTSCWPNWSFEVLAYFLRGRLPWQGLDADTKDKWQSPCSDEATNVFQFTSLKFLAKFGCGTKYCYWDLFSETGWKVFGLQEAKHARILEMKSATSSQEICNKRVVTGNEWKWGYENWKPVVESDNQGDHVQIGYMGASASMLLCSSIFYCQVSLLLDFSGAPCFCRQELCAGHPPIFASFLEYAKSLRFEAPHVESIRQAVDM